MYILERLPEYLHRHLIASSDLSVGFNAKSFEGDDYGASCYLCAKFGRNRRGRRLFEYLPEYLPRHLIASGD